MSLPLLSRHLQTQMSLCKSSVRSGPGKSCATLTQWPTACFNVTLSSHPHFDGIHRLVHAISCFSNATLAFLCLASALCFCSQSVLWQLCVMWILWGNTHGNRAMRYHILAGKESKAEKVTRVVSFSFDDCQETHICLWSMCTGSWSSTCTEVT